MTHAKPQRREEKDLAPFVIPRKAGPLATMVPAFARRTGWGERPTCGNPAPRPLRFRANAPPSSAPARIHVSPDLFASSRLRVNHIPFAKHEGRKHDHV